MNTNTHVYADLRGMVFSDKIIELIVVDGDIGIGSEYLADILLIEDNAKYGEYLKKMSLMVRVDNKDYKRFTPLEKVRDVVKGDKKLILWIDKLFSNYETETDHMYDATILNVDENNPDTLIDNASAKPVDNVADVDDTVDVTDENIDIASDAVVSNVTSTVLNIDDDHDNILVTSAMVKDGKFTRDIKTIRMLNDDANSSGWMTSMEFFEMTDFSRHADVKRSIIREIDALEKHGLDTSDMFEAVEYINEKNQLCEAFLMSQSGVLQITAKYSAPVRAKLIRYIREREESALKQRGTITLPDFTNPAEAARAYADAIDANMALEDANKELTTKADFFDIAMNTDTLFTINEASKLLKLRRNKSNAYMGQYLLHRWLKDIKLLQEDGVPYQKYINNGTFILNEVVRPSGSAYMKTFITNKGLVYIRKIWDNRIDN